MQSESTTIYQAITAIIGEMGGIGKNQRNKDQGYNFRGIDDVLKELHPLFAKHGVFFAPTVIEREYEERLSKQGNVGHVAHLHVAYKVYGPSGDFIEVSTWGEGLDYSDKATNKAMTAAFKYAMFELFAIADPADDSDSSTEDGGFRTENKGAGRREQTQQRQEFTAPETTGEISPDIDLIMSMAEKHGDDFLVSLSQQFVSKGRLTDKQIEAGVKKAKRYVVEPRSMPEYGQEFEFAPEAERF